MCTYCRHFRPAVEGRTCAAFPDGIPREMWIGDNPHTAPVVGDHGIRFEPAGPGRPRRARRG
ncbi:MAG: hypothetical protein JO352_32580 [Chloroflexi bacterium]|nr:hypothetical protein [Chloroflexota bacterium]MBV9596263.1 hypothetical protein [Chloroflexota bacterium]